MKPFRSILVLCEGNHCRSPLAAALLQQAVGSRALVASAGLHALVGHPAHEDILRLGAEMGCNLETHRGQNLESAMALNADLILVMDRAQKEACTARIPAVRGRVFLLGHWLGPDREEIPDPYRRGAEAMRAAATHVQAAVQAWLPRLVS